MTRTERFRAWLAGRHEFQALVEVDPARAAPLGGRPVPGRTCAEFTRVAHGPRASARLQAAQDVQAMLQADLPGARLLAVRDGGPPQAPDPKLRMADGRRPKLLLVGADIEDAARRLVERVCRVWGLPSGRYRNRWVPDRQERPASWQLVLAVACSVVLGVLILIGGPLDEGEGLLGRLFVSGAPVGLPAVGVAVVLAAVHWIQARRVRRDPRRSAFTASILLVPVALMVLLAVTLDAVAAATARSPAAAAVVLGGLCVAAGPIGVSRLERPRLWAVLAWGLPLLVGGIAPFTGELVLDYYLFPFGLGRLDLQVSAWGLWAVGALATAVVLVAFYVGVAVWVLFRRLLGPSPFGVLIAVLVAAVYALYAVLGIMAGIAARAQLGADGLPRPMPGLRPVAVCVEPVEQPFSYIGRAAPRPGATAVYFGRADGRLAVWTAETGGVLLDAQQVALRTVEAGADCR